MGSDGGIPDAPRYVVVETVTFRTEHDSTGAEYKAKAWHDVIYPCVDEVEAGALAERLRTTLGKGASVAVVGSKPRPRWRTTREVGQT